MPLLAAFCLQAACECAAGFEGDGYSCEPINPCDDADNPPCNLAAHEECVYTGPKTSSCRCAAGYQRGIGGSADCEAIHFCSVLNGGAMPLWRPYACRPSLALRTIMERTVERQGVIVSPSRPFSDPRPMAFVRQAARAAQCARRASA